MGKFANVYEKYLYNYIVKHCNDIIDIKHGVNMKGSSGSKECDYVFETNKYLIVIELKTRKSSSGKSNKYISNCAYQSLVNNILFDKADGIDKPIVFISLSATITDEDKYMHVTKSKEKISIHREYFGQIFKNNVYLLPINTFIGIIHINSRLESVIDLYQTVIFEGFENIPLSNIVDIVGAKRFYNDNKVLLIIADKCNEEFSIYPDGTTDFIYTEPLRVAVEMGSNNIMSFYGCKVSEIVDIVIQRIQNSVLIKKVMDFDTNYSYFILFNDTILNVTGNKEVDDADIRQIRVKAEKHTIIDKYDKKGNGIELLE